MQTHGYQTNDLSAAYGSLNNTVSVLSYVYVRQSCTPSQEFDIIEDLHLNFCFK